MTETYLKTPVAFIIFNRPDTTEKVFEAIRQAKPEKLLVIADGPRLNKLGEAEKCAATRAIIDRVDWNCEVLKNYSDINLGCGKRPATGISWVFEQVEEAIILEDDCLPHPTFFCFCEELLEKYRDDERIMHISGNNYQHPFGNESSDCSYYFSRYIHLWGWACWRRAWKYYDYEMKALPEILLDGWLDKILPDTKSVDYWTKIFREVEQSGKTHIWDYQWILTCWVQGGISITPSANLVSNIGFDPKATHTRNSDDLLNHLPVEEVLFPLKHPNIMIPDTKADSSTQKVLFARNANGLRERIKRKIDKIKHGKLLEKLYHSISLT